MSSKVINLPFHFQRKVGSTQTLTGYITGTERQIQSAGLAANVLSIALVTGTTWRITLENVPATVDISTVQVGDAVVMFGVNAAWDEPQLWIVLARNVAARTIDVSNAAGIAVPANAPGTLRAYQAIPQYSTVSAYQKGVLFNACLIPKNAGSFRIRNPYISVQSSYGVDVGDAQLDFITVFFAQVSLAPFRSLFEGLLINLNIFRDRVTGLLSSSILPGFPEQYELIELAPSDLVLENRFYPNGNNLYLETSSGDLTEYQKVNLEEWVERIDRNALAIPITPAFTQQLQLTHEVKRGKGADAILVFCSIGNENTGSAEQLVKGRCLFELEAI